MTKNALEVFSIIISCEISQCDHPCEPDEKVATINGIMAMTKLTRYGAKKALKELRELGLIKYTSKGRPATMWEEAHPPINGYALTEQGFESKLYKVKYEKWEKDLEEWMIMYESEDKT